MDPLNSVLQSLFAEPVHRKTLDNGLTILVREDTSSQVSSVQLWVKTGSIHEGSLLGAGLSHYLEHMLFKGTEKRNGKQISREVQSLGGHINAYTSFDRTVYYIDLPSEHTSGAIEILADACFNSTLPAEEVDKEREVILREIDMGLDDPDQQLSRALFETAYRTHPYKYPIIGYKDIFKTVTRDELVDYYHKRYVPNNAVLVVTGDVKAEDVFQAALEIVGGLPRARLESVYIPAEPVGLAKREQSLMGDVNISRIGLGFSIPGLHHEDAAGVSLLAAILGSGDSSILWKRLRQETGIVHHVDVSAWNPGSSGLMWVSMMVDPENREAALEAFWKEIESLKQTLIDETLILKAQRQAMVSEINNRKTMSGQAARIGAAEVVVGDIDYSRIFLKRIQKVSAEDLQRLLQSYLVEERLTQVTFDPANEQVEESGANVSDAQNHLFDERTLEGGSRLLFQQSENFPKVHIRVVFKGGALWENPDQRGITSLAAIILTKDTETNSALEVATKIESVGGSFSEFSGNNTFGLSLEVLPQDTDLALELLEQSLLHLKLDVSTFEVERDGQVAHVKESLDDIVEFGIRELREKFFGEVAYSVSSDGRIEDLEKLSLEEVQSYLKTLVTAGNCVVAVSGQFDRAEIEPKLETLLNRLPRRILPDRTVTLDTPAQVGREEVFMDRQQAVVFQAFPCVGVCQDDLMLLASVLDELFSGMSSQLFERVRDDLGLAYYVGSSRVIGMDTGMLFLYGGTQPSTAQAVLDEMTAEVERIQSGKVESDEFARVKTRLKAQRRMSMQTIGSRAMQAALNVTYGLPVNDWMNFDDKLDQVTVEDLADFAAKFFSADKRLELIVRPEKR
ncbi:MAG: pitrilysin family protein [Verrucomicrobia bacterium]|nr:pitrilysin family protein [Verrucomicrobiota bacterium]MDA1065422.1 pitrilysin family protein [Verrucomicrobiota bacterium]